MTEAGEIEREAGVWGRATERWVELAKLPTVSVAERA
jgi:hypothetical protein